MFCPKCGTKIGDFDKFCNNCGWKNKLTYKSEGIDLSGAKKAVEVVAKAADVAKDVVVEKADDISKKVDEIGKNVSSKTKEINDKAITPFFDRAINFFKRRIDIIFTISSIIAFWVFINAPGRYSPYEYEFCNIKVNEDLWYGSIFSLMKYAKIYDASNIGKVIIIFLIIALIFVLFLRFNNSFINAIKILFVILFCILIYNSTIGGSLVDEYEGYDLSYFYKIIIAMICVALSLFVSAFFGIKECIKYKKTKAK